MSWNGYIDTIMGHANNNADYACIIGKDGIPWTNAEHAKQLKLSTDEAKFISECFAKEDFTPMTTKGIWCDGVKYQFLRDIEKKLVVAKKKDHGAISIQCSKTAIVIAHTKEGGQQGECNKGVGIIAEYLEIW
ncbi:hypothetical protein ACF0H5_009992 [Mactra antiquata]